MKKNYTNYSSYANAGQKVIKEDKAVAAAVEEETVDQEPVEEIEETPVVEQEEEKSVIGIVSDCKKLRVRADATTESAVICEIEESSIVVINMEESTDEFYKVHTEAGAEGYCMRKFVTITS